jgi:hypothetical protein
MTDIESLRNKLAPFERKDGKHTDAEEKRQQIKNKTR